MKTRTLCLARDYRGDFNVTLYSKEPKWDAFEEYWHGKPLCNFCSRQWSTFCPALKCKPDEKIKLKLTQLKNGIKLERVQCLSILKKRAKTMSGI
ncbi:hypothetical protein LCGC14_0783640 [marine sediment metagenome]|uniref:Uncharacterized protein n=1 Tax=marine sediment metagenome TaxID=412755 RepID=A0A0F9SEN6_9ZZZZ